MKTRFGINRTTRHRELLVQSRKGEELNPHQAAWLEHLNHENFLRVSYDVSGEAERCTIAYDVNGLVSFGRYIRKCVLSGENLVGMLTDLACAYGTCTSGQNKRFWQQSMLFDKRYVFIDDVATLRFVFIPLDGLPFTVENSPLVLLQVLGDTRRVKYATPNDYSLARNLYSYALNEQGTFSFNSYRTICAMNAGSRSIQMVPYAVERQSESGWYLVRGMKCAADTCDQRSRHQEYQEYKSRRIPVSTREALGILLAEGSRMGTDYSG